MPASPRSRVLVAVSPPLLGDLVGALLEESGIEVVLRSPFLLSSLEPFDVALISEPAPPAIVARSLIRLSDGEGRAGPVVVLDATGARVVPVRGTAELLALVERLMIKKEHAQPLNL